MPKIPERSNKGRTPTSILFIIRYTATNINSNTGTAVTLDAFLILLNNADATTPSNVTSSMSRGVNSPATTIHSISLKTTETPVPMRHASKVNPSVRNNSPLNKSAGIKVAKTFPAINSAFVQGNVNKVSTVLRSFSPAKASAVLFAANPVGKRKNKFLNAKSRSCI